MDNSGLNTVLLVIIVVALVALGVWYFGTPVEEDTGGNVEINLPAPNNDPQ